MAVEDSDCLTDAEFGGRGLVRRVTHDSSTLDHSWQCWDLPSGVLNER